MTAAHPDRFVDRHIGLRTGDIEAMVTAVGATSLDSLIDEAVPSDIRLDTPLDVPGPETEAEFLARVHRVGRRNRPGRALIGLGYYGCITPSVILRNVFENPGWYTPYTPYQAEVAQGRLEALLNFQTTVADLTGMAIANASLLDEATAAAEAMAMLHRLRARTAPGANRLLVSRGCFPQTIDVVSGRAAPVGIEIEVGDPATMRLDDGVFGVLLQYPAEDGAVMPIGELVNRVHAAGALVAVCSDLLALTLLTPPGELGADVVVGNSQRFGVPMGYGGPHAAFFATREEFVRQTPGRIIGLSIDRHGNPAYRMSLQTREQHIRRERATSNICTAQALLANMAGFYAVYHGADGLRGIARRVHGLARRLAEGVARAGDPARAPALLRHAPVASAAGCGRPAPERRDRRRDSTSGMWMTRRSGLRSTKRRPARTSPRSSRCSPGRWTARPRPSTPVFPRRPRTGPDGLVRRSAFLTHPVFDRHRSETQMMRYLKRLERRDVGLDTSMIPLGSCTMKLTAASEIRPVSWPDFAELHPFVSRELADGYQELFREVEASLCAITGLSAVSLQPNSGAQGEFAGAHGHPGLSA